MSDLPGQTPEGMSGISQPVVKANALAPAESHPIQPVEPAVMTGQNVFQARSTLAHLGLWKGLPREMQDVFGTISTPNLHELGIQLAARAGEEEKKSQGKKNEAVDKVSHLGVMLSSLSEGQLGEAVDIMNSKANPADVRSKLIGLYADYVVDSEQARNVGLDKNSVVTKMQGLLSSTDPESIWRGFIKDPASTMKLMAGKINEKVFGGRGGDIAKMLGLGSAFILLFSFLKKIMSGKGGGDPMSMMMGA